MSKVMATRSHSDAAEVLFILWYLSAEHRLHYNTSVMRRKQTYAAVLCLVLLFACAGEVLPKKIKRVLTGEEITVNSITISLSTPFISRQESLFDGAEDLVCTLGLEIGNMSKRDCFIIPHNDVILVDVATGQEIACQEGTKKYNLDHNDWCKIPLEFSITEGLDKFLIIVKIHPLDKPKSSLSVQFLHMAEVQKLLTNIRSQSDRYSDPLGHYQVGTLLMEEAGFTDRAIKHFKKAIEADNAYYEAYRALSNAYVNNRRYEEAIPFLENTITIYHDQNEFWLALIQCCYKTGDNARVEQLLAANPSLIGDNPEICLSLADIYLSNKQYRKAAEMLYGLVEQQPGQPFPIYIKLAEAYLLQRDKKMAGEILKYGLEIYGYEWQNVIDTADFLVRFSQHRMALAILQNYRDSFPDDQVRPLYEMGVIHLHFHRYPKARSCFTQVLELNPSLQEARFNLALIHSYFGQHQEAITLWQEVADQAPGTHVGNLAKKNIEVVKKEMNQSGLDN